jgi:hypothetical protein
VNRRRRRRRMLMMIITTMIRILPWRRNEGDDALDNRRSSDSTAASDQT